MRNQVVPLVACDNCGERRVDESWRRSDPKLYCGWCRKFGVHFLVREIPKAVVEELG